MGAADKEVRLLIEWCSSLITVVDGVLFEGRKGGGKKERRLTRSVPCQRYRQPPKKEVYFTCSLVLVRFNIETSGLLKKNAAINSSVHS